MADEAQPRRRQIVMTADEQAAFRALLASLAAHANDLDPVLTACEAVEDLTARSAD